MNEKLKLKVAEMLLRGIAILVWHALRGMDDGDTKDKQQHYLSDAISTADLLKEKHDRAGV